MHSDAKKRRFALLLAAGDLRRWADDIVLECFKTLGERKMNLNRIFQKLSTQFSTEFETLASEITHRGMAGLARERAISDLLSRYLPRRVSIGTGTVIDARGGESRQTDLVIYDKDCTSVFTIGGVNFYPCEGVIAVGEVKTQVDSGDDLATALDNIASTKGLDRTNQDRAEIITGPGISLEPLQRNFNPRENYRDQILGFLFTGGSMAKEHLLREFGRWNRTHDRRLWTNIYCDYNRFLMSYESNQLSPSTMEADNIYCTDESEVENLLLLFVCILADFVNKAHVARPNYFDYAGIGTTRHTDHPLTVEDE